MRQGTSSYGRIATQARAETGQYSSTLRAKLTVPCKLIPKGASRPYLLTLNAVAPNAALLFLFGAGNDTFTVESAIFRSLYADGGFGTNTLVTIIPLTNTMTFRNF